MKNKKNKITIIRMSEEIKDKLQEVAQYYGLTDSGCIRYLITDYKK